uniref:Polyprotein protein n=1 Tax=Solanum tuberosum TaxID=4113 RepID=M1A7M9_SOLTU
MSMLFGIVKILDMPADTDVPPATTRDELRVKEVVAAESETETDEDQFGVDEKDTYEVLTEVEKAMVDSAMQILLTDTPMADPSGASSADVAPGTNAPTDGATV